MTRMEKLINELSTLDLTYRENKLIADVIDRLNKPSRGDLERRELARKKERWARAQLEEILAPLVKEGGAHG